jgi:hypothetical protein
MNITINGITKDCTEWGCKNVSNCEHGCADGFELKDDYRTDKEKYEDMGDFLRDRAMDRQHELAERGAGAK